MSVFLHKSSFLGYLFESPYQEQTEIITLLRQYYISIPTFTVTENSHYLSSRTIVIKFDYCNKIIGFLDWLS